MTFPISVPFVTTAARKASSIQSLTTETGIGPHPAISQTSPLGRPAPEQGGKVDTHDDLGVGALGDRLGVAGGGEQLGGGVEGVGIARLAPALLPGVAEQAVATVAHGVVDAGDRVGRPRQVDVAGAVGIDPVPVGALGVDPCPRGLGIRIGVGAGGPALVLQLPQALGPRRIEQPRCRTGIRRRRTGDRLRLLDGQLTGDGRLGDLGQRGEVLAGLQLPRGLGAGRTGGASEPVLCAPIALPLPHDRLGHLRGGHRLQGAACPLDPLPQRHQLLACARHRGAEIERRHQPREALGGLGDRGGVGGVHKDNSSAGV